MKRLIAIGFAGLAPVSALAQEVSGHADIVASGLRMVFALAAVLALLVAGAWLLRRLRLGSGGAEGQIEIVGGLALGTKDRVVLLRVMDERVLVGIGPSGMTRLHVLRDADPAVFELPDDVS